MFGTRVHRILYITFLSGIAFSLPTSIFLTSVFSIALVSNWILDFTNYRNAATLIRNRSLLAFLLIYALYLLFMLNTSNLDSGLHVLRLKLPLLGIPLVIATSVYISNDEKRIILSSFIIGVLIASVAGTIYYFGIADDMNDRRDISLFISHIRLALMVCLAFSISAYYTLVHDYLQYGFFLSY